MKRSCKTAILIAIFGALTGCSHARPAPPASAHVVIEGFGGGSESVLMGELVVPNQTGPRTRGDRGR